MRQRKLAVLVLLALPGCNPVATYDANCSVPLPHWRKQSDGMNHHAVPMHIRLDEKGRANFAGQDVTDAELADVLDKAKPLRPEPFMILSAQPHTPCKRVRAIRQLMDQRYCNRKWACGEGSGVSRDWNPVMDLPSPDALRELDAIADNLVEQHSER